MTSARPSAEVNRLLAAAADRAVAENRRTITPDDLLIALLDLSAEPLEIIERFRGPMTIAEAVRMCVEAASQPTTFSGVGNGLARFDVLYEKRKPKGRGKRRAKR